MALSFKQRQDDNMPASLFSSIRKLTRRAADLARSTRPTPEDTDISSLEAWTIIMADGEEDYSSLPLTDRWVHKVKLPHQ